MTTKKVKRCWKCGNGRYVYSKKKKLWLCCFCGYEPPRLNKRKKEDKKKIVFITSNRRGKPVEVSFYTDNNGRISFKKVKRIRQPVKVEFVGDGK